MLKENWYKKIKTYIYKIENYVILLIHGWEKCFVTKAKIWNKGHWERQVYCLICFASCLKKYKERSKLEEMTDLASFKFYSEKWKSITTKYKKYNKVFGFVMKNMLIKPVKVHFLKNIFLTRNDRQKILRIKMTLYPPLVLLFKQSLNLQVCRRVQDRICYINLTKQSESV